MFFQQTDEGILVYRDYEFKEDCLGNEYAEVIEPEIESEIKVIEALAYSIDVTFGELLNEGAPVSLGNAYAQYEFTMYLEGYIWTFGFGNRELAELNKEGSVLLTPQNWNELEDVRAAMAA